MFSNLFSSNSESKPSSEKRTGPIVKTGPTRGQERSRNDDGRWRAKRSDAGTKRSN